MPFERLLTFRLARKAEDAYLESKFVHAKVSALLAASLNAGKKGVQNDELPDFRGELRGLRCLRAGSGMRVYKLAADSSTYPFDSAIGTRP